MPPVESSPVIPDTVDAAIDLALECLESLALVGEDVEDEWQYVQDLTAAWRSRLDAVTTRRVGETIPPDRGGAIVRVCAEAALVEDPHRAIDWLSTFPQVVLVALDERP